MVRVCSMQPVLLWFAPRRFKSLAGQIFVKNLHTCQCIHVLIVDTKVNMVYICVGVLSLVLSLS
jgi:hypothetical protein